MHKELLEYLRTPSAYPHPTDDSISVRETHISYVFLTGPYAYKIKKPVDLGFLDFTTLEKRRQACHDELRLNKRSAPRLYVDVAPIYEREGEFRFDDAGGEIVEYAVKMHQFREEDLLTQVLERGELTVDDAVAVARKLAQLHRESATDERIASFGSIDVIKDVVTEIFEKIARFRSRTISEEQYAALSEYCKDFVNRHADRFAERVRAGKIRECHGDLHLNNMCYYQGELEFFDRIEFNEAFRNIDVVYDAAFLYMDLLDRGRHDLANRFVNTYLERTGDYLGAVLLPFYTCCRALIRGEVLSIQAEAGGARPEIERQAKDYFELARAFAVERQGAVILMCGVPGSGKSTVARELAIPLGAIHLRSDAIRKHLANVPLDEEAEGIYTPAITERTYESLVEHGVTLAAEGMTVILDATFGNARLRARVLERCAENGLHVHIVHCTADRATLSARLAGREDDVSDANEEVLRRIEERFEAPGEDESGAVTVLDTRVTIDYERLAESVRGG